MNKKCQIFTPEPVVEDLLNVVGYINDLTGKKVIDTACGDGNMLVMIVRRYIKSALNYGLKENEIKRGLEIDIEGVEIDSKHHRKCIDNLNEEAKKFNIDRVKWNIHNEDALKIKFKDKYNYVIGNPPYINYRDLDIETREFVRKSFETCSEGKFDYCYAFIEHAFKLLKDDGIGALLIPNSIFKNVFAQKLRDMLTPFVLRIDDFRTMKLFDNALTSSAFLIIDKNKKDDFLIYSNRSKSKLETIHKSLLRGKWVFNDVLNRTVKKKIRFGDIFKASISIATLYNKAFILSSYEEFDDCYYKTNDFLVEKNILRNAVSPRSLNYGRKELIIFPYFYSDNKINRYDPKGFKRLFPFALKYLNTFSDKLNKRDADKNVQLYEYGRSQALSHLNQEKLLLSTVVTNNVKVYKLGKEDIPYSGVYIVKSNKYSLDVAKKILESKHFLRYVKGIGISASGKSLRITAADINNFEFAFEEMR